MFPAEIDSTDTYQNMPILLPVSDISVYFKCLEERHMNLSKLCTYPHTTNHCGIAAAGAQADSITVRHPAALALWGRVSDGE